MGEGAPSLLGHEKKKKKKKRFTLEPKTSARNYNIVKSIVHWTKTAKKKAQLGVSIWVVRKVLKWRWLALLPVRLLLFAGGPSARQRQVCRCCCRLVDPVASKWKAAGDGCLPLGRCEHMNQKDGAWDRRWGGNWLAREKCTSNNSRCWLLAACCLLHHHRHRHRQPVSQNLLKIFYFMGFAINL